MRRLLSTGLVCSALMATCAATALAALPPRGAHFSGENAQGEGVSFRVARFGTLRVVDVDFGTAQSTCPDGRTDTERLETAYEAAIQPDGSFSQDSGFTTGGEGLIYSGRFITRHRATGQFTFFGRNDCFVRLGWRARSPFLRVRPRRVLAGSHVRVTGLVPIGCDRGETVTLISRAFSHRHDFAGLPAIFTTVRRVGGLSRRTRIPRGRRPGLYRITARCGGGNLGVSARLRVLPPPRFTG